MLETLLSVLILIVIFVFAFIIGANVYIAIKARKVIKASRETIKANLTNNSDLKDLLADADKLVEEMKKRG